MKKLRDEIIADSSWLRRQVSKKSLLRFSRTINGSEDNRHGFLLDYSNELLLIQNQFDFMIDGYIIINIIDIDFIQTDANLNTQKKILISEGILDTHKIDAQIDVSNWKPVFNQLRNLDHHAIVECENVTPSANSYLIGPIKKITSKNVAIQFYSGKGILDKSDSFVNYKDITLVTFGDNYTTTFRKYLKTQ